MTEPLSSETIAKIRKAIEKGGVLMYMESYGGNMYIYTNGYMWYLNLDAKGIIKTAATMRDQLFEIHMFNMITPPKLEDVKPLPDEFKAEVAQKLTGKVEDYIAMAKEGKIVVGGGMTTELSFSVEIGGESAEAEEKARNYIERVLNPESFGCFIFH